MTPERRAFALLGLLVVLAAIVGGVFVAKPSLFPGASKRAATSTQATAALLAATNTQGATAAASLAQIGVANTSAPESPAKSFIGQEVGLAMSLLPSPDAMALLAAERRRVAVMEGRLDEARRLYEQASKNAAHLQQERDHAVAARQAADLALEQAAAADHAKTLQLMGAGLLVVVLAGSWLWAKLNGIGPESLGKMLHDIRAGKDAETSFHAHTPPRWQAAIAKARKLAAP